METKIINPNRGILWAKVWGIAAMQGAVTLAWVIYKLYLPLLLVELGLAKELALTLLVIENALEILVEPIFGWFSDRQQQVSGSRLTIISIGAILASALFIALPVFTIFSHDNSPKWIFIALTISWASVMAIVRSPVVALLGRSANTKLLPQAASLLTLCGGLIGALRFDVYGLILNLGAGFTFAIGSFALLGAAALLRWVYPPEPESVDQGQSATVEISKLSLIFLTGMGISWGFRFLILTVSQTFTLEFGTAHTKLAMTLWFVVLGLAALPAGRIASKFGNSRIMLIGGWGTTAILLSCLLLPTGLIQVVAITFLVFMLSLILNGAVPFALGLVPPSRGGLGVGMYFGGFGGGMSLFDFLDLSSQELSRETCAISASLTFLLVLLLMIIASQSDGGANLRSSN
ncbi:MAG: MFS transporter [Cyanobacteria bacterium P01_G01_bin.67]